MKDWVVKVVLGWILENLSEQNMAKFAKACRDILIPYLRIGKEKLLEELRKLSEKSESPVDDALVVALEKLLEALIPSRQELTACLETSEVAPQA